TKSSSGFPIVSGLLLMAAVIGAGVYVSGNWKTLTGLAKSSKPRMPAVAGPERAREAEEGARSAGTGAPLVPEQEKENTAPVPEVDVPLRVASTPPGATVLIDGEERGVTPTEVQVPSGREFIVAVSLEGYTQESELVHAGPDLAPLRFELKPMPYILKVES